MGKIHVLHESISNKIAAGEVVERPASAVKELVENAIDAGASSITVEIKEGGISYIRVSDNGCGMNEEDAEASFVRHATSKISHENDLNSIKTLGFRGEALASIASVSEMEMLTKMKEDTYGTRVLVDGGLYKFKGSTGCPDGTTVIVKNLFHNTPARLKFLKKESREAALISDILYKLALSRPEVSFKYINNNKLVFNTPGDGNLKNTLLTLYGKDVYETLIEVSYKGNILSISGFIGNPEGARSNRSFQTFFINNRYIKNRMLSTAVDNAYKTFLPVNKFAFCVLYISILPELVDVNVHPTKAEVRFQDDKEIFSAMFNTVRTGLAGQALVPDISIKETIKEKAFTPVQVGLFNSSFDYSTVVKETGYEKTQETEEKEEQSIPYEITERKDYPADLNYNSNSKTCEPKNLLPPLVIIGQSHHTYILAEGPDGLYIIDQHAAHERIYYEKYKKSYESDGIKSQQLIAPLVIELTSGESDALKDSSNILEKLGFDFEYFGNNSVMLRAVPFIFGKPQLKKLFVEIMDMLENTEAKDNGIVDQMLCTMACRAAIKANDRLNKVEMEELVARLREVVNPFTCPHGRPTTIKLTTTELEKKFKRIQ